MLGLRKKDGFVGVHGRKTASPQPEHISARWQDLESLLTDMIAMRQRQIDLAYHPALSAASLAFGFVYIHPFTDGNGRVHRSLIQHVLTKSAWPQPGFILPISESLLAMIHEYAFVLRAWSHAMLPYISWEETSDHNVQVTNHTDNLYRYFDASNASIFLIKCIQYAVQKLLPDEIAWLQFFDEMKRDLQEAEIQLPDQTLSLMLVFLRQNNGRFSKRAREKEFVKYDDETLTKIEAKYREFKTN
jgi:hypothetical protein